jgi:hypothetical protein
MVVPSDVQYDYEVSYEIPGTGQRVAKFFGSMKEAVDKGLELIRDKAGTEVEVSLHISAVIIPKTNK